MKCFWSSQVISFAAALIWSSGAAACDLHDGDLTPPLSGGKIAETNHVRLDLIIFLNGQNTSCEKAQTYAVGLAQRFGSPVVLDYNDLTLPLVDWFSTAIEKIGGAKASVNAATASLVKCAKGQVECGKSIYIVGHSAGSICILNAVRAIAQAYADRPKAEREALLSRIHVLTIGGATFSDENLFSDGWPALGSVHHLWDTRDRVANVAGEGDFLDVFDSDGDYHAMAYYLEHVQSDMLISSGTTKLDKGSE